MKHLIKDLEWYKGENCIRVAYSPSHEYKLLADDSKYKVAYFELEAKNKEPVKFATGFKTELEAKEWAYNHHVEKLSRWLDPDLISGIEGWFRAAKPEPTNADKTTQIGCNLEEVGELIKSLCGSEWGELVSLADVCKEAEEEASASFLNDANKLELLDALCDQIVTAVGVAYMMGFYIVGALKEVNASNYSKFVNGKPLLDDNGKIIKGENYFKPDLEPFVGGSA